MSDQELVTALAEMLPDKIRFHNGCVRWEVHNWPHVTETEWLHVCWTIEQELSEDEGELYVLFLSREVGQRKRHTANFDLITASWQQRARALIDAKN